MGLGRGGTPMETMVVYAHQSFARMCYRATILSMKFTAGIIEMTHVILTI